MSKFIDLTGKTFGKWKAIELSEKATSGNFKWLCECSCGTRKEIDGNSLRSGKSTKCRHCFIPANKTKYSKDSIHTVWSGMKDRCYNPNHKSYTNYGSRGITICGEWLNNPVKFYDWAYDNGYKKGMSIERIDVNGNYESTNCTFIPLENQSENRRNNHYIIMNGETKTLSEWCRVLSINRNTVKSRIRAGMSDVEALTKPVIKSIKTSLK